MALYTGSLHDARPITGLTADGLRALEPQLQAERTAYRAQLEREARLLECVFEPLGRLLDRAPARRALEELRELDNAARQRRGPLAGAGRGVLPPFQINTHPGSNATTPPLDDVWSIHQGNAGVDADQQTGTARVALAASADEQQQSGAAGVLLWVVPQSDANVLALYPHLHVQYRWQVKTVAGPTAHSHGYLRVLIKAHDAQNHVLDGLTTDWQSQLWSAGSSGVQDEQHGQDDFESTPSFVLRGGAWYEVWFWVQSDADAGKNFFGGWSAADSSLQVRVDLVEVNQY